MKPGSIKFDSSIAVFRDAFIPVDSQGLLVVVRDAIIPVDSLGFVTRDAIIPVDSLGFATRDALIPVDSLGHSSFSLSHAWNVRNLFEDGLYHQWKVVSQLFSASIQHNWTVVAQTFGQSLTHTWKVIPNVAQTFGINPDGTLAPNTDVHCPTADITITP